VQASEKLSIPHDLKIKILKIQVENDTEWDSACQIAATMLDVEKEKKRIANEARRLMNSEMMTQLNTAKATIAAKERENAKKEVRANEDNFRVLCNACQEYMHFSSRDEKWTEEKAVLYKAFGNWSHVTCLR
jgi:hypothetical protein